jgi:hypothetical protein
MSLINDKKSIFTEIGAFNSIGNSVQLSDASSSISSINNGKDIGGFLLDILVTLVGSEVLKKVTGELLGDFITDTKPELKNELSSQLVDYNGEDTLPTEFVNNGYTIPAKDIDVYGKLKTDPASDLGTQIYSENNSTNTFDRKAYEAIVTPNTEVTYDNITILYNDASDEFTFKPVNSSLNISDFINQFVSNMYLFDRTTFITEVLNIIFGSKSASQNKSEKQILDEIKINKTLQNFIDEKEDLTISDNDLSELQNEARQIKQGFTEVSIGCCDILKGSMSVSQMTDLNSRFRNANNADDAGNIISNGVIDSFQGDNTNESVENQQTINDGIIKRIINAIIMILSTVITTTPEARFILIVVKAFKNNNVIESGDPSNDLISFKLLINCLIKKVKILIFAFIFGLVKEELIKLIIPISKRILREKINQYVGILRSLIGFG